MNLSAKIKRVVKLKIATLAFTLVSIGAFATLGDGGKPSGLNLKPTSHNLSLRNSYNYRGSNLFINNKPRYITLNGSISYQKGNATYIVPLKKKVILDKIKFNPASH